ncbi:MAG: TonB C-terminal domain-containing protein [Deltaproteobacteria bacterium]|nr:TonB C-terminal domain-containing protein [Deltaproteobacteria bacterium]
MSAAFVQPAAAGGAPTEFPMEFYEPDEGKSTLATGSISAAINLGAIGLLFLLAALNPEVVEEIIPVQLLREEMPKAPAPARRALAERRKLDFAPAMQTVQPQIVNKRVIANAAPAIDAEMLQMDSLNAAAAPTQVKRSAIDVDRVSAISAVGGYQASKVEVNQAAGPAVRGPIGAAAPVGPSVGPRKVAGTDGNSFGTGSLAINQGSSVRDGVLTSRDVVGSPTGPVLVSVDTAVGEGNLSGPGGTGSGLLPDESSKDCTERPEVQAYLDVLYQKIYSRWTLPYGIENKRVTLRFEIDVAGSTSSIQLVKGDNAIGASAIDAMRASSPFPPMPDGARCLANRHVTATFSSSSIAG